MKLQLNQQSFITPLADHQIAGLHLATVQIKTTKLAAANGEKSLYIYHEYSQIQLQLHHDGHFSNLQTSLQTCSTEVLSKCQNSLGVHTPDPLAAVCSTLVWDFGQATLIQSVIFVVVDTIFFHILLIMMFISTKFHEASHFFNSQLYVFNF